MDDLLDGIYNIEARLAPRFDAALQAVDDIPLQADFIASFDMISQIYTDFRALVRQPPFSQATEEQRDHFRAAVTRVDELYVKLCALQGQFTDRKTAASNLVVQSQQGSQLSINSTGNLATSNVKLPKIALPSFDGSLKSWPTFHDLFNTLIHLNGSLSDIERFQYLISSLSGEPLSLVKPLPLTADNYTIAYDSLVERYQNERVLVSFYWKAIWNAPVATSDSERSLRSLLNTFNENIVALEQFPHVNLWDFTLLSIFLQKMDNSTRKRFEIKFSGSDFPTFADAKKFILDQCRALEANALNSPAQVPGTHSRSSLKPVHTARSSRSLVSQTSDSSSPTPGSGSKPVCYHCRGGHGIYSCTSFSALSPRDRYDVARRAKLCLNCLGANHLLSQCPSTRTCRQCQQRHHSLLHFPQSTQSSTQGPTPGASSNTHSSHSKTEPPTSGVSSNCARGLAASADSGHVLLATAVVYIRDRWGAYRPLRALIDPASQASFIVDSSARQLGLSRSGHQVPVFGLGLKSPVTVSGTVSCAVKAIDSPPIPPSEFIMLKSICGSLPDTPIDPQEFQDSRVGKLADPSWFTPGPVQVLLGADIYPSIIRDGLVSHGSGRPIAINTIFGWALLGPFQAPAKPRQSFLVCAPIGLDDSLRRFWEIEEIPSSPAKTRLSPDELEAEILFRDTVYRCPSGRFGVALPFKSVAPTFVNSRQIADRRWLAIERRLVNQDKLRELYLDFMSDYLTSGHMTLLESDPPGSNTFFIPHHPVIKVEDGKQKIRVVFDASAQAANHVSLNETLFVGPKLQQDLVALLLQFRSQPVVFACDIRQMYRQILISPEHRRFQLIRFRFTPDEPIQTFQLNTVTYGVSSAPFLAVRTLLHLAELFASKFPLASEAIRRNLYVDDLLCGAASVEDAQALRHELVELLNSGCFELRKWASNCPEVLRDVPIEHCRSQPSTFDESLATPVKILGLQWCAIGDIFSFTVTPSSAPCTKRSILSEVARIYDPLGFLSPISFFAKYLIQRLWKLGLDWDDRPPDALCRDWLRFQSELSQLSSLQIPRHTFPVPAVDCQLHAFCDASESGYAAALYVRFIQNGTPVVRLLISKSKVAPVKLLTIPRLELCAAVLLSDLVTFAVQALSGIVEFREIFAWSDSTVVLNWIRSPSHRWKTFVAHRVEHIQQRVPLECWRHVGTANNPADPASRGLFPSEIISCSLWWSGPSFLVQPAEYWPVQVSPPSSDAPPEERKLVMAVRVPPPPSMIDSWFIRFSSLRKIQGIVAYCLRHVHNRLNRSDRRHGGLTDSELHSALRILVRHVQKQVFASEISTLQSGQSCAKPFRALAPFLDGHGILRVGGRLQHCPDLPFETRHPALLPSRHRLTELLIRAIHNRHCHPGLNSTCYLLQQKFWVLSTRRAVRHYLASCHRCFRVRPSSLCPMMGDFPSLRVSQLKAFSVVGVDYGGPFPVLMSRGRGVRTTKAYLCLFVCFATKALHVEVASDLSTDAFLAALRRFIARRGRCSTIYSDNGTNFVGANKQLSAYMKLAVDSEAITWHFNPPSAPHFGGLWESGVKSVKTHIHRVIGEQVLTYEELNTLVIQVESLLNSRPLCPVSSDPNDVAVLTPGHFLTLEPLTAPPDPDLSHLSRSKLSRWQLVQNMHHRFWSRWRDEYLHTLYQRGKWHKSGSLDPSDVGTLVLVEDDNAPPLKWRIGRIVELFPGKDGICRVADVRTSKGLLRRPLVKLCPLPVGQ